MKGLLLTMAGTFFASSFLKEITKESERLRKKEGFSRDGEKGEETKFTEKVFMC